MLLIYGVHTEKQGTYPQYSPQIHAAAQRVSAQLPSSLAFTKKVSSHNNLTINCTEYLLAARTRAVTSMSWSRIWEPTSTPATYARSTSTDRYHSKSVTLSYVSCEHKVKIRCANVSRYAGFCDGVPTRRTGDEVVVCCANDCAADGSTLSLRAR